MSAITELIVVVFESIHVYKVEVSPEVPEVIVVAGHRVAAVVGEVGR